MNEAPTPWWRGASLYHIYPLSFCDSNGDGFGDLPGLISRLEHVRDLGVEGIWLSPFYATALTDFGYDTTDQKSVDPRLGDMRDFDRLVTRCRDLGLRLVLDQVYTYTSHLHPWFEDSRRRRNGRDDWYLWADARPDGSPPNNWQAMFGGPGWVWDVVRGQYYMTHFMPGMPHLRVQAPEVEAALLDIARFWLDRGADGFRLDVINLTVVDDALRDNPPREVAAPLVPGDRQHWSYDRSLPESFEFVAKLRELVGDKKLLLGEVADRDFMAAAKAYTGGADKLHSAYFLLAAAGGTPSAGAIRAELEAWSEGESWPTWSFSNHDAPRGLSRLGGDAASPELARLLIAVLVAARGSLLLYQGEELGLPDGKLPYESLRDPASRRYFPDYLQRDGARTPMVWAMDQPNGGFSTGQPWLPVPEEHLPLAVDAQEDVHGSTLTACRDLLTLRRELECLRTGAVRFLDLPEPLLGLERMAGEQQVLCLFNVSDARNTVTLPEYAAARSRCSSGAEMRRDGEMVLDPYGFVFLELSA